MTEIPARRSPAVQALYDRIKQIEEANTYRGKVTNAGHEMIGVVQGDIQVIERAEAEAAKPLPTSKEVAVVAAALRDSGRLASETDAKSKERHMAARHVGANLLERLSAKLLQAGVS